MLAVFRYTLFYQHEGSLFILLQCVANTKDSSVVSCNKVL